MRRPLAQPLAKFFADRGTHLAAMIAYFAPALVRLADLPRARAARLHRPGRGVELPRARAQPALPVAVDRGHRRRVVETITENATTLGVIGGAFLLWTSLSLFSVLESAFNIVYGQPNRRFLRGKVLASLFMIGSLIVLFVALVVGSIGFELLKRFAPGFVANRSPRTRSRCSSRRRRCSSSSSSPTSG